MKTIQLNITDTIDLNEYDYYMIIASKLYEDGLLTVGQAANLVGITKRTFIELLRKYKVSVFSSQLTDLHSDIANA